MFPTVSFQELVHETLRFPVDFSLIFPRLAIIILVLAKIIFFGTEVNKVTQ